MELFGIGPSELIFVILIAILVMGPDQMQNAGRTVAKWMRSIMMSDALTAIRQVSRETRKQWTLFIREANEDLQKIDPTTSGSEPWQNRQKFTQPKAPPKSISTDAKPAGEASDPDAQPSDITDDSSQPLINRGSSSIPNGDSNPGVSTQTD